MKVLILQADPTIPHAYASTNRASKYVRQKLIDLKGEIDKSTIIVGNFNIPSFRVDTSSREKICKDMGEMEIGLTAHFLLETTETRRHLKDVYKALKGKNICQPWILYSILQKQRQNKAFQKIKNLENSSLFNLHYKKKMLREILHAKEKWHHLVI